VNGEVCARSARARNVSGQNMNHERAGMSFSWLSHLRNPQQSSVALNRKTNKKHAQEIRNGTE
jgi:hypothetical protein